MLLGPNEDDDDKVETSFRIIYLNDEIKNEQQRFKGNSISTAKYNIATFMPKFLLEQFRKAANVFFLFTVICQQIPDVSPTNRFSTAIPLSVVLIVAAIKEILEDLKRHNLDTQVNNRDCKVFRGSEFIVKRWKELQVGDIVRLEDRNYFPADLVLLSSSEPDALCYIETANLDGETNLKIRQGIDETAHLTSPEQVALLEGVIKSEQPNNSLYTYEATLRLREKEIPLDPMQLLLRGAQLRNTRWIYAVVVNTGHETKLMRNASATPIKRTRMDKMMNKQILFLFLILLSMAMVCATASYARALDGLWERNFLLIDRLYPTPSAKTAKYFKDILTFIILFNNLIPISLIVTVEFVKLLQSSLINSDLDMYYEETDTPAVVRTSSLVEELGQIEYIFSDKTGTLTCNIMEFRMCTIAGKAFADIVPDDKRIRVDDNGKESGYYTFERMMECVKGEDAAGPFIHEFFTLLSVCHTVIPEMNDSEPPEIIYQASSPDEGALVQGAADLGWVFTTRRPRSVTMKVNGESFEYEVLNICEFNSTRKRMSAVVRCPDGKIKLLIKGADTVILERLSKTNPGFVDPTFTYLEEYATEGLRTLCIASRDISDAEYAKWSVVYEKAATTINNRGAELDKAAELIEKDLFLIGATAIEDRLQDGVPDTIHTLAQAGIKIWVLTGDRQETAINIGYSCKLITEEMNMIVVNETTHFETKDFLEKKLAAVRSTVGIKKTEHKPGLWERITGKRKKRKQMVPDNLDIEPLALIIDGRSLDFALEKDIELLFLELACYCKAVICCRVSPLQKALVVKLVKRNVEAVLLAIGDGANDVSMIQAAHVGVGISGQEGLQAARSADVAISQFRYLRKLILVHGSWSYFKLSKLILYSFYKNITLYMTQFWFAMENSFSGQTLYESWILTGYNAVFAVAPPVAMGLFDNYLNARMLDRYPQLYSLNQRSEFFNVRRFWGGTLNAIFHSIILYYFMVGSYAEGTVTQNGKTTGLWFMGIANYAAVLTTITLKAALVTDLWVSFTFICIFGSLIFFLAIFPVYSVIMPLLGVALEYDGITSYLYGSIYYWFLIFLSPTTLLLRDFCWKYYQRTYKPKAYHIVEEIQKFNIPDYRPRMEWFRKAVHKVRQIQRIKRSRGFAFSQNESGQADLIRIYDTTKRKPKG